MVHIDSRSQRNPQYPQRLEVSDDLVDWDTPNPDYDNNINQYEFTSYAVELNRLCGPEKRWADDETPNTIDWISRITNFYGKPETVLSVLKFDKFGYPINPAGRTGLRKNGLLGKIGPNQAADPIVIKKVDNKYYIIAIERRDKTGWALPGGMIDKTSPTVSITLKKELYEEAINCHNSKKITQQLDKILNDQGVEVYRGYVDDCRNTDTSWMETVAYLYDVTHYPEICNMNLASGDDAVNVVWLEVSETEPRFKSFYADHKMFVYKAIDTIKNCHNTKETIFNDPDKKSNFIDNFRRNSTINIKYIILALSVMTMSTFVCEKIALT